MKNFLFSKKFRLNEYKSYKFITKNYKFIKFKLINIFYKENYLNYPRIGFILKKKILKNPVTEIK